MEEPHCTTELYLIEGEAGGKKASSYRLHCKSYSDKIVFKLESQPEAP
jgi:hypothetical protein